MRFNFQHDDIRHSIRLQAQNRELEDDHNLLGWTKLATQARVNFKQQLCKVYDKATKKKTSTKNLINYQIFIS